MYIIQMLYNFKLNLNMMKNNSKVHQNKIIQNLMKNNLDHKNLMNLQKICLRKKLKELFKVGEIIKVL